MSSPEEKAEEQEREEKEQNEGKEEQDPNALTEEDKEVYQQILSSINRMNKKIKTAKDKVPEEEEAMNKRTTVNEIAQKLIQAKEKSDIITKQNLISDVHQSFQQVVVDVYSQNEQLKKKMASLVAIIKQQTHKITQYKEREERLKLENEKLRQQMTNMKDEQMMGTRQPPVGQRGAKQQQQKSRVLNDNQSEDYDFWTMPQNENSSKKRKEFVADSNLWVNQKDINESVFITDQPKRR